MLHKSPCWGAWSYLPEVSFRAFLVSEPTVAQIIGRTEQRDLEGLLCLLLPPKLFPFDLSIRTDRCFLQQDPEGADKKETP